MRRALLFLSMSTCAGCATQLPVRPVATVEVEPIVEVETAEGLMARGRLLLLTRRHDEAEAAYRRAYALGEPRALWRLGNLLRDRPYESGRRYRLRRDEARRCYERCLIELPDEPYRLSRSGRVVTTHHALRLQLADVLLDLGWWADAERLLDAILEEHPDDWVALETRGDLDLFRRDVVHARERYRAALARIGEREAADSSSPEYKLRWADDLGDMPFL